MARIEATALGAILVMTGCDRIFGLGDPYQDAGDMTEGLDAGGQVRFVQAKCAKYASGPGPYTVTLTTPTTAGNLLLVALTHAGPTDSLLIFSDDSGDAFVPDAQQHYFRESNLLYASDVAGGATVVTATRNTGQAPIEMCVSEYSGAATDPIAKQIVKPVPVGTNPPELELINGVNLTAAAGSLVYIAIFDGNGLVMTPGVDGLDVHPTMPLLDAVLEDSATSIDASRTLATVDSSLETKFDPYIVFGVAIKPR